MVRQDRQDAGPSNVILWTTIFFPLLTECLQKNWGNRIPKQFPQFYILRQFRCTLASLRVEVNWDSRLFDAEEAQHILSVIVQYPQIVLLVEIIHDHVVVFPVPFPAIFHWDFECNKCFIPLVVSLFKRFALVRESYDVNRRIGPEPVKKIPAFVMLPLSVVGGEQLPVRKRSG